MHISIDIELMPDWDCPHTMRRVQIGAVAFDLNGAVSEPHELLQADDRWLDVQFFDDHPVAGSTADWWYKGTQIPAMQQIMRQPVLGKSEALFLFAKFIQNSLTDRCGVWAKPPRFDLAEIEALCRGSGVALPWRRDQEYCLRTLLYAARKVPRMHFKVPDFSRTGLLKHHGLHDAAMQATVIQSAFRALTRNVAERNLRATLPSHEPRRVERASGEITE